MKSEALEKIQEFRRAMLANLHSQCSSEQQIFFSRLYPGQLEGIPSSKIDWAIHA